MRALLLVAALAAWAPALQAASASTRFCDGAAPLSARQQDRLLRVAAILRQELAGSGREAALISRSGLNLKRFGVRYSHAGISLKASPNGPWSVRQLYYACDEGRPRIFDQGVAGFLTGTDDPSSGHVSIVLLPAAEGAALARMALANEQALRLLAGRYSANAYAFGLRYQNCNQWVVELMAAAWGALAESVDAPADLSVDLRAAAQRWLGANGYAPDWIDVGSHPLMFAAGFVPWIHVDDHPRDDVYGLRFRVTMPATIEAFVRERLPDAERIEICHNEDQVVIRRGWVPLADGCQAGDGDRVMRFE